MKLRSMAARNWEFFRVMRFNDSTKRVKNFRTPYEECYRYKFILIRPSEHFSDCKLSYTDNLDYDG